MMNRSKSRSMFVTASAMVALAGTSLAQQNVSGGGRILDANLSRTEGRINARASTLDDQLRLNNAIITGQAGAGRSFRGSVGYRATDQFGGTSSTDSTYAFRRDSVGSSFSGLGLRTSDALRYQFGMTSGGAGSGGASAGFGTIVPQTPVATGGGGIQGGPTSMRSTSDWATAATLRPVVIGSRQDELGAQYLAKASPLTGIRWVKVADSPLGPATPVGPTALTPGATPAPNTAGPTGVTPQAVPVPGSGTPTSPTTPAVQDQKPTPPPAAMVPSSRLEPTNVRTESIAYTRVMDRLTTSYEALEAKKAPEQPKAPPVNEALVRLRRLLGQEPAAADSKTTPRATDRPTDNPTDRPSEKSDSKPDENAAKPTDTLEEFKDPAVVALVKSLRSNADMRMETLMAVGKASELNTNEPAVYAGFMKAGEEALAKSRFFVAEDQFNRALGAMSRDPLARVGRTHAQIGAGLYLSASANLRSLLAQHPEMLAQRYGDALLPKPERMDRIIEQLRLEMESSTGSLGRESGLLIAYLGYQRGMPTLVSFGLDGFLERIAPEDAGKTDRALHETLRLAWLGDWVPAAVPEKAPQPTTPQNQAPAK
ncbi:MAG: hypothetical protein K2W85_11755 [Phycisphaerales bacterium]|nr:hypothetical protein [Phycisphaerales bacterium]